LEEVLRTDELGTIEVITDGEQLWWERAFAAKTTGQRVRPQMYGTIARLGVSKVWLFL